jgi:hypothetical protein
MRVYRGIALIVALSVSASIARADEFRVKEVRSLAAFGTQFEPHTLAFNDHHDGDVVDPATGLIPFEEWARTMPLQKQFLSPYPSYAEPTINATVNGLTKPLKEKLHMYLAEARFALSKSPQSIDLARYMTVSFLERVDPAIREQLISATNATNAENVQNTNPLRPWCEAKVNVLCIQSRYQLEGKLPTGIHLINQLAESKKKIADYLEFKSELRILLPSDLDQSGLRKLSGIDAPINSVLEQTIFQVNQVMQFGRFLAIFQQDPTNANQTTVTAFVALAIKTRVLENKKKYENVPVLRNLVPAQVLMGRSSFNTGSSLSAGLPVYARNRIKAVAGILNQGQSL